MELTSTIACMYARQDNAEDSIRWLKRAIEKGFKDWDALSKEKTLENIRGSSYYKQLMKNR